MTQSIEVKSQHLFVRTVADALEKHLSKSESSSMHWVAAYGEESTWGPSNAIWPKDTLLGYLVEQGCNEGWLVRVVHHINDARPKEYEILLTIKLLSGQQSAFEEASTIRDYIESMDTGELLQKQ